MLGPYFGSYFRRHVVDARLLENERPTDIRPAHSAQYCAYCQQIIGLTLRTWIQVLG
jgi:hypothetical protein